MTLFHRIIYYFRISSVDPDVMVPQVTAWAKQAPLLYFILNANALALVYTHFNVAPALLTIPIPAILLIVSVIRTVAWKRQSRIEITSASALRRLQATYYLVAVLGMAFTAWALSLLPYGDAYAHCHVAFFMSITVIGCLFCLMHLRPAALLLTAIVGIPFFLRFVTFGQPVLAAMAVNFVLVLFGLITILLQSYRDFARLVLSQKHLAALSDQNFKIANLDSLTNLPNRRSFFRNLEAMLDVTNPGATSVAVGLIDLDGFKPVNDVYGHAAGDRVLIEVGRRLETLLGPSVLLARLGGDEFGYVTAYSGDPETIQVQARSICGAIQIPIRLPNGTAQVAATIGIALHVDAGSTLTHLIERADYALYYAKARQRGTAVIFSEQHENAIRVQSLIEQELRRADFATEMSMRFQPIVEACGARTMAYEALARWESPLLGNVSPIDFIAAAERSGQINRLTEILFGKALEALGQWPADIDLSFNLSVRDLASPDLIGRVRQMVEASGIGASRIVFEITETALMHDFAQARDMLLGLKDLGAKIALDDFGTGYSSLNYIHRLPLDEIKIDRSFIADIGTAKTSRDIVKSIVDLSRNLKITCVVEGVETAEQVLVLRALGCTTMQGFYFGRPMPVSALAHQVDASSLPISLQDDEAMISPVTTLVPTAA